MKRSLWSSLIAQKINEVRMLGFEEVNDTGSPLVKQSRKVLVNITRNKKGGIAVEESRIQSIISHLLGHSQNLSWCFNSLVHGRYTQGLV